MAGGEEFDGSRSAATKSVEQARMKSLGEEDVSRDSGLHGVFQNTSTSGVEVSFVDARGRNAY
jgi:hypothetical protein